MANFFEVVAIALFVVAMVHSSRIRGLKWTALLFSLPFFIGWVMEALYMWSLHGYFYPAKNYMLWLPGEFPLAVACGWAVAVYFGLLVMQRFRSFKLGFIAGVGLDALLEPLALSFNLWVWTTSNPLQQVVYFGAPLINALVWPAFISSMLLVFSRLEKLSAAMGGKYQIYAKVSGRGIL